MKIAVIQMMYPQGHCRLDEEFVKILAKEHQLILVDNGKYFSKEICNSPNVERISIFQPYSNRWDLLKRALRRLNLLMVLFVLRIRNKKYDKIIFLNIHNTLYGIERWLPEKNRVIIHHNDVDLLFKEERDLRQFNKVKERFYHVFLADYISVMFSQQAVVDKKYIFTVHQPLVFDPKPKQVNKESLLVGLGNSMDEKFIKDIVSLDTTEVIRNKLILRSRTKEYIGTNIRVFTGFLPRDKYESLYDRAKVSVVFYPESYRYRYSGVIDDSLALGLVVYCNDTLCGRYFANQYPGSVKIVKNVRDLWNLMHEKLPIKPKQEDILFRNRHSIDFVAKQFNTVLNS